MILTYAIKRTDLIPTDGRYWLIWYHMLDLVDIDIWMDKYDINVLDKMDEFDINSLDKMEEFDINSLDKIDEVDSNLLDNINEFDINLWFLIIKDICYHMWNLKSLTIFIEVCKE